MTPEPGQQWRDKDGGQDVEALAVDTETVTIRRGSGKTTKVKRARFTKAFLFVRTMEKKP